MSFMQSVAQNTTPKSQCIRCGLHKAGCESPRMQHTGLGEKGILIVGDFPTRGDDHDNTHFSGETGSLMRQEFSKHGIDLYNDCWRVNIMGCRALTPRGLSREPTAKEMKLCSPGLEATIQSLQPKKIIILGNPMTIKAVYGPRIKRMSAEVCRGKRFRDNNWGCFVYHFRHPKFILQEERDDLLRAVWNRDIKYALTDEEKFPIDFDTLTAKRVHAKFTGKAVDIVDHTKIHILTTVETIVPVLRNLLKTKGLIAFDYEATNIKPYQKGQKLLSCSFTTEDMETYTFPLDHKALPVEDQRRVMTLWGKVVADKKIFKIVAGYAMEYSWSKWMLSVEPESFIWDTQICEHILDNRKGVTGLKFQLFQKLGIEEYDAGVKQYIKSDATGFNQMEKMPLRKMLAYNGIDSYGTMLVFKEQRKALRGTEQEGLRKAYKFFMRSIHSLAEAHMVGLYVDENYYKEQQKELTTQIQALHLELTAFFETHYKETGARVSYTSADDLKKYFFDFCGIEPTKFSKKTGAASLDADTLANIDTPISNKIVQHRKLEKMKTTYLSNILQESHDGIMRPLFPLNLVKSYRSSSQRINFQNLPNRDKDAKRIIRSGIKPLPDHYLSAIDMSGAEVYCSLAYHKDPIFEKFLADPNSDMHRHVSAKVFMLEEKDVVKMIRKMCKAITFGFFYGDWYKSLGETAWEFSTQLELEDGTPMREHMERQGIGNLPAFIEHMKGFEQYFWGPEMFGAYAQWRKDIVKLYKKQGYIETYLGFKFTDKMDDKQATNYPVQSTSFHMLLQILNYVDAGIKRLELKSRICGQIHDEVVAHVHKDELVQYHELFNQAVDRVNNTHDWIVLPFEVEAQLSRLHEDGGNMAEAEEVTMDDVKAIAAGTYVWGI